MTARNGVPSWCSVSALINLLVHLAVSLPMLQVSAHMVQAGLTLILDQGITFLSYPVIGWVTDVFLTRHTVLKCSLILLTTMTGGSLFLLLTFTGVYFSTNFSYDTYSAFFGLFAASLVILMIIIFIKGLFDANALQFGLDQFLEATTQQLVAFIHWYYWFREIGQLLIFYVVFVGGMMSLSDFQNN